MNMAMAFQTGGAPTIPRVLSDITLSRRLERAEGRANAAFVESRARLRPEVGAEWIEVAGALAMYDGERSPCTQTFCLGLFEMPSPGHLDTIERFYAERGAPVFHEVSPIADKGLIPMLGERGYRPVEFTSVMFTPLKDRDRSARAGVEVVVAGPDMYEGYAHVAAEGWRESPEVAPLVLDLARVFAVSEGTVPFIAMLDGVAIASGALVVRDGVALLAGASTIPERRKRGAQQALLDARLKYAINAGCDLAMICAEPGSASQKNAERQGFRIAYTRTKWGLFSECGGA